MRILIVLCAVLNLAVTAYCFFEYQLPHSQFTKVVSNLGSEGIQDEALLREIRWSILGVQGTWWPLFVMIGIENILFVLLVIMVFRKGRLIQDG